MANVGVTVNPRDKKQVNDLLYMLNEKSVKRKCVSNEIKLDIIRTISGQSLKHFVQVLFIPSQHISIFI